MSTYFIAFHLLFFFLLAWCFYFYLFIFRVFVFLKMDSQEETVSIQRFEIGIHKHLAIKETFFFGGGGGEAQKYF